MAELPHFEGNVVDRRDGDFGVHAYQYAFTSQPKGTLDPAQIIYAKSVGDVQLAVRYAAERGVALAVRTGGHQYLGASSTNGANLQLDMSDPAWRVFQYDPATNRARCGPALNVHDLSLEFHNVGTFVPHGECRRVNLGGHCQTGGYGILSRAFGLTSDYIAEFDIVLADGALKTVRKSSPVPEDRDLFWAVLGGSPGNFGVVTSVTFVPEKNQDHPDARVLKVTTLYSKRVFQALTQLVCELNSDPDFDGDFDMMVTMLSGCHRVGKALPFVNLPTADARMRREHPRIYAGNDPTYFNDEPKWWPSIAACCLIWSHRDKNRRFGPEQQAIFDRVHRAIAGAKKAFHPVFVEVSEKVATPLSVAFLKLEIPLDREFLFPFFKRCWATTAVDLHTNGFAAELAERLDRTHRGINGVKVGCQVQLYGGNKSAFRNKDADQRMSFSWRDSTMVVGTSCFYKTFFPWTRLRSKETAWKTLTDLGHAMIGPSGRFAPTQRRLLWAAYQDQPSDIDMTTVWPFYYETPEMYRRLIEIKQRVDPQGVFTPNAFCVGGRPVRGRGAEQPAPTAARDEADEQMEAAPR